MTIMMMIMIIIIIILIIIIIIIIIIINHRLFGEIYRPGSNRTWTAWTLKMGPVGCLETSVINCKSTLQNITRFYLHGGRILKSSSTKF